MLYSNRTGPSCSPMEFGFTFGKGRDEAKESLPFRILVLGDFHGSARGALASRRAHAIDIDSFDEVIARLAPRADVSISGVSSAIPFESFEDFHPDALFRRLGAFAQWRDVRKRLANPATTASAESEARTLLGLSAAPSSASGSTTQAPSSGGDVMSQLLSGSAKPKSQGFDTDAFIRSIVGGGSGGAKPSDSLLGAIDERLSGLMREVLHAPAFGHLECSVRALHNLITGLELDENLQLHLLDVSRDELIADAASAADARASALGKLIAGEAITGDPSQRWSLVISLETFGRGESGLLSRLGDIAAAAGAPLLVTGAPSLVRAPGFFGRADTDAWTAPANADHAQAWNALRGSPSARAIAVAMPRILLRQPYAPGSDEIDSFAFTEITEPAAASAHEQYLWGPAALAPALVIGDAFSTEGWDLDISQGGEVAGLPVHSFPVDGKPEAKPCAEAWLADRAIERITSEGLVAVASVRGRDAVRVSPLQSIAGGKLAAWWA